MAAVIACIALITGFVIGAALTYEAVGFMYREKRRQYILLASDYRVLLMKNDNLKEDIERMKSKRPTLRVVA